MNLYICSLCCLSLAFATSAECAVDFRVLNWGGDMSGIYFQSGGDQMLEIEAGKRGFSETYSYTGQEPLQLFRQELSEEVGTVSYQPIAVLKPTPNFKTIGLICFEVPESNQYRLYPLDIGLDALPAGAFCFVNMTTRQLAFQIGESAFYLESGQNKKFMNESSTGIDLDSGGRSIVVRAAEQQSDTWNQVLNVRWMLSSAARSFVIVYDNPMGKIAIRRFSDDG
ncbi:hypothetical protein [Cerasicoccus frondis]|uniref:hypothetical protein n=1 Tax=Cerasicoccus frondis TaxID=490090 RepID=UPI00285270CE|nr:hypothetical protein [Cerasicoccus frondis]